MSRFDRSDDAYTFDLHGGPGLPPDLVLVLDFFGGYKGWARLVAVHDNDPEAQTAEIIPYNYADLPSHWTHKAGEPAFVPYETVHRASDLRGRLLVSTTYEEPIEVWSVQPLDPSALVPAYLATDHGGISVFDDVVDLLTVRAVPA